MSSSFVPLEHTEFFGEFSTPIAEFTVGKLALARLFILTGGAVLLGTAGALACLGALIFCDAQSRPWIALFGAVMAVLLYFRLRERTRLRGAQAHVMAHLAHLFSVGPLYLYISAAGWQRAREVRGLRVLVFPEGFVHFQANRVEVVRWDEITVVRRAALWEEHMEAVFYGRARLFLATADGRKFEFDNALFKLKELRKLVEQHTLPHLLERALNASEAGREVSFGVLSARRYGLVYGNRYLPWTDYGAIETRKGSVHVKPLGAKRSLWKLPLIEVPNIHVLMALARYICKYGP